MFTLCICNISNDEMDFEMSHDKEKNLKLNRGQEDQKKYLSRVSPVLFFSLQFSFTCMVDIDQLKLIMMLVGTPGPELLMKISSESVSVQQPVVSLLCVALCCFTQLFS